MNKLEKIFAIGALVIGVGLVSYGLHREKPLLRSAGLLIGSYPVGLLMRRVIEEDDKRYLKEKKNYNQE